MRREIDWRAINSELASRADRAEVEVDISRADVRAILEAVVPSVTRMALRAMAGEAARAAVNHHAGRLD